MTAALRLDSTLKLNDGNLIPRLGLGVYLNKGPSCVNGVKHALKAGYRHVDSAQWYQNEKEVGQAVLAQEGWKREDVWVTTKIWDSAHGYDAATRSIENSLKQSALAYFDCILIHSPNPGSEKRLETYRALIDAKKAGKVKSIGVSNYGVKHIQELLAKFPNSPPSMNQIELSPFFQRKAIVNECLKHNIAIESYSPLGKGAHTDLPELKEIGKKYGKTPAHILIRWVLQSGYVVLPKSSNPQRIEANADLYDFVLDESDMKALNGMETGSGITW
ncbi:hypothetical protein CBS101457_002174 [Exobasidium rhododendri]|nr:hypothetical protein CBS101457_002174 [Exobasidium rhododendri]